VRRRDSQQQPLSNATGWQCFGGSFHSGGCCSLLLKERRVGGGGRNDSDSQEPCVGRVVDGNCGHGGMPRGIWTMERRESIPSVWLPFTGTPITGRGSSKPPCLRMAQHSTAPSELRTGPAALMKRGVHGHEGGVHGHEGEGFMGMKGGVHGHEGGSMGMKGGGSWP